MRAGGALVALVLAAALAACGHKGPPLPPHVPQPVAPQAVSFLAQGDTLVLSWRYPPSGRLPEAFRVQQALLDEACPGCPPRYEDRGLVYAETGQGHYEFRDEGLKAGATYAYVVVPQFGHGAQGSASAPVKFVWRGAQPPSGLVAVGTPGGIRLFWDAVVGTRGYVVYRAVPGAEFVRLGQVELPPYLDSAIEAGQTYQYAVATVGQAGEGPPSKPVEAVAPRE